MGFTQREMLGVDLASFRHGSKPNIKLEGESISIQEILTPKAGGLKALMSPKNID